MAGDSRSQLPQPLDEARQQLGRLLPLFTYGTLLVERFTADLLQHEPSSEPAQLGGYRQTRLTGLDWPVLVPDQGATVCGRLYRDLGVEDYRRLDAYEGVGEQLYFRAEVVVQVGDRRQPAFVYLPTGRTIERYQE